MNHPNANRYDDLSATFLLAQVRGNSKHSSEGVIPQPDRREQTGVPPQQEQRRDKDSSPKPGGTSDANLDSQDQESTRSAAYSALAPTKRNGGGTRISLDNLPLEEAQRKQRIREAARERQRKHRASVRAKRMAELGMAIVSEGGAIEQTAIGYTINEQGQYEAVLADPSHPNFQHTQVPEPFTVPQAHATPGQMFASTLLLGLSWTPRLKQQLLRTLHSTTQDLAAFEPFIAAAFDHWERGRSLHYATQSHHMPSPHMQIQPAPYTQPYPVVNEGPQRSLVQDRRKSLLHGQHLQSPSLPEVRQRADGDSDAQIEPELAHSPDNVPACQSRESGGSKEAWSERRQP